MFVTASSVFAPRVGAFGAPVSGARAKKRPALVVASFREIPDKKKVTTPSTRTRAVSSDRGGVPSLLPNLEDLAKPFVRAKASLNEGIASFYDESSGLWEEQWGEHMHHGFYPEGKDRDDHARAQVDMIDEALKWAEVDGSKIRTMLDVGCGIGGSSRHIARTFGCDAEGITLSPVQARRANELSSQVSQFRGARTTTFESPQTRSPRDEKVTRDPRLTFRVADALAQPFPNDQFDLVWSMESGEHMPDKKKFIGELTRVCAPGGKILIATWCHRDLRSGEHSLPESEQFLLDRICDAYYLPKWCSVSDYERIVNDDDRLTDLKTADWSKEVAPFWRAVIGVALTKRGVLGLLRAGPATVRGGLVMPLMQKGLRDGTIKFNLITATKRA
jgi:tocopherol O-methyltransferase